MDARRCLEILREIKDVAFATVDSSGLPQIRMIDVMLVEDEKLYFCTSRGKEFYRQLTESGRVAVTGMNKEFQMVRLNGKAVKLTAHQEWIDRIFENNPSMNAVYPGESRYVLEAFCIDNGEVEFFDLGQTPVFRARFSLGGSKCAEAGFLITDACIHCGKCRRLCPQQCIENFRIQQSHCLHCGLCFEECPVGAIQRKGMQ